MITKDKVIDFFCIIDEFDKGDKLLKLARSDEMKDRTNPIETRLARPLSVDITLIRGALPL
ncbi:hypothetical protein [Hoylesella marshii]|uniref:hypothetical protein n=1 Tax=Hoylesella marshii TaxID=189722 RepID=UPI0028D1021E|nr:hypothetical protein [Hoylesella marshii]